MRFEVANRKHAIDEIIAGLTAGDLLPIMEANPTAAQDEATIASSLLPGLLSTDCNPTRRKRLKSKILLFLKALEKRGLVKCVQSGWWWFTPENVPVEDCQGKSFLTLWRPTADDLTEPCLFCGREHNHGTGDGHRAAHCPSEPARCKPKGAFVSALNFNGITIKAKDGYIVRSGRKK